MRRLGAVSVFAVAATVATAAFSAWALASPGPAASRTVLGDTCTVVLELPVPGHNLTTSRGGVELSIPLSVTVSANARRAAMNGARDARSGREVILSVGPLPAHVTGGAVPERLPVASAASWTHLRASVQLHVGQATAGTYAIPITARCGDSTATVEASLTVLTPVAPHGIVVRPAQRSVAPGDVTTYCLTGAAASLPRPVTVTGLPPGTHWTVDPSRHGAAGCLRLTVVTSSTARAGDYPFTVTAGTRAHRRIGTAVLHVATSDAVAFTISGNLQGELSPGVTLPLDLRVTNPGQSAIRLTGLTVAIDGLDAAHAAGCPVADNYQVAQFSGDTASLVVPKNGDATLSGLGIPPTAWPQISMLDTAADQAPCLGSTLSLTYSGTADPA